MPCWRSARAQLPADLRALQAAVEPHPDLAASQGLDGERGRTGPLRASTVGPKATAVMASAVRPAGRSPRAGDHAAVALPGGLGLGWLADLLAQRGQQGGFQPGLDAGRGSVVVLMGSLTPSRAPAGAGTQMWRRAG